MALLIRRGSKWMLRLSFKKRKVVILPVSKTRIRRFSNKASKPNHDSKSNPPPHAASVVVDTATNDASATATTSKDASAQDASSTDTPTQPENAIPKEAASSATQNDNQNENNENENENNNKNNNENNNESDSIDASKPKETRMMAEGVMQSASDDLFAGVSVDVDVDNDRNAKATDNDNDNDNDSNNNKDNEHEDEVDHEDEMDDIEKERLDEFEDEINRIPMTLPGAGIVTDTSDAKTLHKNLKRNIDNIQELISDDRYSEPIIKYDQTILDELVDLEKQILQLSNQYVGHRKSRRLPIETIVEIKAEADEMLKPEIILHDTQIASQSQSQSQTELEKDESQQPTRTQTQTQTKTTSLATDASLQKTATGAAMVAALDQINLKESESAKTLDSGSASASASKDVKDGIEASRDAAELAEDSKQLKMTATTQADEEIEDEGDKRDEKKEEDHEFDEDAPKQETFFERILESVKKIFEFPSILLHTSSFCSICAMFMTDMISLRVFMVLASSFSSAFWRMRRPVLWVPFGWALFFGTGHLLMLFRILMEERKIIMTEKENEIYTTAFSKAGFTGVQFKTLYDKADIIPIKKGNLICKQGEKKKYTYYLYSGQVAVRKVDKDGHTLNVAKLLNSGFIGKVLKNQPRSIVVVKDPKKDAKKLEMGKKKASSNNNGNNNGKNENANANDVGNNNLIKDKESTASDIVISAATANSVFEIADEDVTTASKEALTSVSSDNVANLESANKEIIENRNKNKKDQQKVVIMRDHDFWKYTLEAETDCELLRWDREDINKYCSSNSRLIHSAINAMNTDLRKKLEYGRHFQNLKTYQEMMSTAALNNQISYAEDEKLRRFRTKHHITHEEHVAAVQNIGWTEKEFDRKYKYYFPVVGYFYSQLEANPPEEADDN